VSRITYKCYTRWNGKELKCLCKVGNPACDRFKGCETEEFEHDEYKGIEECMRARKYKKQGGVIKQI